MVRKSLFYLPVIVFVVFYGWLVLTFHGHLGSIPLVAWSWVILFLLGSMLLSKGQFWGGFLGMLPGTYFIYLSTQDTGQAINIELPLGLIVLLCYGLGSAYVFYQ